MENKLQKSLSIISCVIALFVFLSSNKTLAQDTFVINDPKGLSDEFALATGAIGSTPIYEQIAEALEKEYKNIGDREARRLLQNKDLSIVGGLNSIGINYSKPFVDFSYVLDRRIEPELGTSRWMVTDTMSVLVDASKIFGRLKNDGKIDLTEKNLNAMAGLVFKRSFTYVHFALSYEDGLMRDFEKLFFPFKYFGPNKIKTLGNEESLIREDSISITVGGIASAPLYEGITGMAGVLARFNRLTKTEVFGHKNSDTDPNLAFSFSFEKTQSTNVKASAIIQADFLKLLRMTLFSYDFTYSVEKSYKIFLKFKYEDLERIQDGSVVSRELQTLLRNQEPNVQNLAKYVVSEETRNTYLKKSKLGILLFGRSKEAKTTQVGIVKDGIEKKFFKHNFEKVKYTDDLVSRLVSSVLFRLTDTEMGASKAFIETKKVSMEYESEKNLLEENKNVDVKDGEKLTIALSTEVVATKTTGNFARSAKEKALFYLDHFSGVNPIIVNLVQDDQVRGPLSLSGSYKVGRDGILHLNNLSVQEVYDSFEALCDEYPKNRFLNFRNLFNLCENQLQKQYLKYFTDLHHTKVDGDMASSCIKKSKKYFLFPSKKRAFIKNCLANNTLKEVEEYTVIPLMSLRNLLDEVQTKSYSKIDYYNLFGVQNIFFHGSLQATTPDGNSFVNYFNEGAFKGLGLIDDYMRRENMRFPASVVVD